MNRNQAYELTESTNHLPHVFEAGTRVYKSHECDYGLANDDTRATGEEYVFVTIDPQGGSGTKHGCPYGGFTVPVRILRPIVAPPKPYDNYEISPCTRTEEPDKPGTFYFEVCEPHEADVWTLYGHIPGEGAQAIGDFATREYAEEAFQRITGIPFAGGREIGQHVRVMHSGPKLLAALRSAAQRLGALIDADEDTENDDRAYDEICAAIEEATGRTA